MCASNRRVAVADPLPLLRRGVMASVEELGATAEAPDDLLAWLRGDHAKVVVMTVLRAEDWELLVSVGAVRDDRTVIVALLADTAVDEQVRAVRAGADSTLPRDVRPGRLREVLAAALRGRSVLPVAVVRALVSRPPAAERSAQPTDTEREWLQALSDGATVGRLAERAGYSERMMFRLLRDLYGRVGAEGRAAALIRARDAGWVR